MPERRNLRQALLGSLGLALLCGGAVGCGQQSCEASIDPYATFNLSCASANLTKVDVSGPCAPTDAGTGPNDYLSGASIGIMSLVPGTCHLSLTFATGFTYDADVVFDRRPGPCGGTIVSPTQMSFNVDNPPSTCAGGDPGASGG
ncbi:MAG TPA: hypothetical protein VGP64_12475 [Polyangia bacterium]|jgi:hypothetical protein